MPLCTTPFILTGPSRHLNWPEMPGLVLRDDDGVPDCICDWRLPILAAYRYKGAICYQTDQPLPSSAILCS